jgi:hypothetical protein
MLASPRSPDASTPSTGMTPGVIGAQEGKYIQLDMHVKPHRINAFNSMHFFVLFLVYRDPRMRRLAEQQKQQATTPKPEKLSFKEKMKMFAMETGEIDTPKDKSKVSKAQREIEIPPAANN